MTPQHAAVAGAFGARDGDKRLVHNHVNIANQQLRQRGADGYCKRHHRQYQPLPEARINHRDQPPLERKKLNKRNPKPERRHRDKQRRQRRARPTQRATIAQRGERGEQHGDNQRQRKPERGEAQRGGEAGGEQGAHRYARLKGKAEITTHRAAEAFQVLPPQRRVRAVGGAHLRYLGSV